MIVDRTKAKIIMLQNGILMKDISKDLGISRQRTWQIMGKTNIQETTLERLASALKCNPADIVKACDLNE